MDKLQVPDDLSVVEAEIAEYRSGKQRERFEDCHHELDNLAARILGLDADASSYVTNAMRTEIFLRELQPMYSHRGFREQPYSDHAGTDRYDR